MALINGTAGNDTRVGTNLSDTLYGHGGNDHLEAREGDDFVFGGAGLDTLRGQGGNDRLYGEAGNDWLRGGTGHDWLFGGDGDDRIDGDEGNDTLSGGHGNDVLSGGNHGERDVYLLDGRHAGTDTVVGFSNRAVLSINDSTGRKLGFAALDSNRDGKVSGADALVDDTTIKLGGATYKGLGFRLDTADAAFEAVVVGLGPNGGAWNLTALTAADFV